MSNGNLGAQPDIQARSISGSALEIVARRLGGEADDFQRTFEIPRLADLIREPAFACKPCIRRP